MKTYSGVFLLLICCILLVPAFEARAQVRESGVAVSQPTYAVPARSEEHTSNSSHDV
jgi:hypothetical protein